MDLNVPLPRVLLLADVRGWAFDGMAKAIASCLQADFCFEIAYVHERPSLALEQFDLMHVLYEQETYHLPFLSGDVRLVGHVASHEWEMQGLTPADLFSQHLRRYDAVLTPSMKLLSRIAGLPVPSYLYAAGVDTDLFQPVWSQKDPELRVGWAGNPTLHRTLKNVELLEQACAGICELRIADGSIPHEEMPAFYRSIDVIVCPSRAEGNPNPLLEGMACGAFPVSFDVGIAPMLIEDGINGLLIREQTVPALRAALLQCRNNLADVRRASLLNRERIRALRDWRMTTQRIGQIYRRVLRSADPPAWQ